MKGTTTERKYNARHILINYAEYESRRSNGDLTAVDTLIDTQSAIAAAELTPRMRTNVKLYFEIGFTLEEIAEMRGITKQGVKKSLDGAVNRIQRIFDEWEID